MHVEKHSLGAFIFSNLRINTKKIRHPRTCPIFILLLCNYYVFLLSILYMYLKLKFDKFSYKVTESLFKLKVIELTLCLHFNLPDNPFSHFRRRIVQIRQNNAFAFHGICRQDQQKDYLLGGLAAQGEERDKIARPA